MTFMTTVFHRKTCRLCESAKVELAVPLAPIPLVDNYTPDADPSKNDEVYPVDLYMCLDCGHVQVLDVISSESLWSDDYTFHSGLAQAIVDHFDECAQTVVSRQAPAPGGLVFDIGSNDGTLLKAFKRLGFAVLGVDPVKPIAKKATEAGIETIPDVMTPALAARVRSERGPAAVITAFNVFAHSDDMASMAESIRSLLAPDGVFVFEASYLLDILDHLLLGTIFHEHMGHHSVKPLARFLKKHGMELIDVERSGMQGGSIMGTAQLIGGPRAVALSVGEILALEARRGLDRLETVKAFSARIQTLKGEIRTLVADCKRRGATIAGFGAARSNPTILSNFELWDDITFIVDDHPQKVNKFSPGRRIPVLPTSELYARKPDYVVILAWVHAKKIIATHKKYLEQGGRFVLCCPELLVIGANEAALS